MPNRRVSLWIVLGSVLLATAHGVRAEEPAPEDQAIDTIRALPQIGASDQRRILEWVQIQVDKVANAPKEGRQAAAAAFRKTLRTQFDNQADTPAFRAQLRAQVAQIAVTKFADPKLDRWVGFAVGRAMVDFNALESVPGLLAGLKSPEESIRFLCAEGLSALISTLPGEKAQFDQAVVALREAGQAESSPVVLSRIYAALAYPNQIPAVFESYLALFEKRLAARRSTKAMADGAEIEAYEFFRTAAVLQALTAEQKAQLARPLAVFLRLDAERYDTAGLTFAEIDRIERSLDGAEAVLAEIAPGGKGGKIRDEIGNAGYESRAAVRAEAYNWVGNPAGGEPGALNSPPFNVPPGAP